jgi:O-antigen ligase
MLAQAPKRLAHLARIALGAAAATAIGVALGLGLTTPVSPLITSIIVMALCLGVLVVAPWHGLLLWLILYPFTETRINIPLGASIADLSLTRLVIASLSSILLAQIAIGRRRLPRLTALDVVGLLSVIGIGLSAAASADLVGSLRTIVDSFLMPLLFYFIVKNLVTSRHEIELLLTALLIVGGYSAVFAIYEQLTGNILLSPGTHTLTEYTEGIRVLRSVWGSNAIISSVFALTIPIAFYRFILSQQVERRAAYLLLAGLLMIGMFVTYKRAAWIAMFVSFLVMAPLFPAFRRVFIVLLIVASVPLAVYWDRLSESDLVEQRLAYNVGTLNGRTGRWEAALALWRQEPIFGHGFRSFDQLSGFEAVENHYLHLFVSGGLAAFVPFVLFFLLTLVQAMRLHIRGPSLPRVFVSRPLLAVFLAMLSTYLVKAMTGIQSTPVNLLIYILIGAFIGSQGGPSPLVSQAPQAALRAGERALH